MNTKYVALGACCALLCSATVGAQVRFELLARDVLDKVPDLQIVTIRDTSLNTCYTLFVIGAAAPDENVPPIDEAALQDASRERDRQLAELSLEFERARTTAMPGTLGPNVLRYEWEGQKVSSQFERMLREKELGALAALLKRIANAPKLAVAGPIPCAVAAPPQQTPK